MDKKRILGWYIVAGLVVSLAVFLATIGSYAIKLDEKNEQIEKNLQEQRLLIDAYKERINLADSAIIFDAHLAKALRSKGLTADEAADLLDAMVYSWQTTKK